MSQRLRFVKMFGLSLEKPPLIDAHSSLSARTNGEYDVATGVLSMEGIVKLQRPFNLDQMRSEIAAALGGITRQRFDLCSLPSKWLTLQQVARDVAGEDAVPVSHHRNAVCR